MKLYSLENTNAMLKCILREHTWPKTGDGEIYSWEITWCGAISTVKSSLLAVKTSSQQILPSVGKGSYGAAYIATAKADGSKVVLKEISLHGLSRKETETALQEGKVHFVQ